MHIVRPAERTCATAVPGGSPPWVMVWSWFLCSSEGLEPRGHQEDPCCDVAVGHLPTPGSSVPGCDSEDPVAVPRVPTLT